MTDDNTPQLLLSMATVPLLVGLVVAKSLSEASRELGLLSEEVFRGDRLPLLNFPSPTSPNPDTSAPR